MKFITLSCLFLCFILPCHLLAQQKIKAKTIIDFQFAYDSTNQDNYLKYKVRIGLTSRTKKGKVRKTTGWARGNYEWKNWNVKVKPGEFSTGTIRYTAKELHENNYQIHLKISPKNHPALIKDFTVDIPRITNFALSYNQIKPYTPFDTIPINLVAHFSNGQKYSIARHMDKQPIKYQIATQGDFSELTSNLITIPMPLTAEMIYDTCYIQVQHSFDPAIQQTIGVPIHYQGNYTLNFSGEHGFHGNGGYDGRSGDDGENGEHGQHGQNAEDITVFVKSFDHHGKEFLFVRAISESYEDLIVLDPRGGRLIVQANGGHGGDGGFGGNGGAGNNDDSSEGYGGNGGNGGHGGDGGNAGFIQVYTDTTAQIYLRTCVSFENKGGEAGLGGEAGSKGGGQYSGSGKVISALLGVKGGKAGKPGQPGRAGRDGGSVKIEVVTKERLNEMIKSQ